MAPAALPFNQFAGDAMRRGRAPIVATGDSYSTNPNRLHQSLAAWSTRTMDTPSGRGS